MDIYIYIYMWILDRYCEWFKKHDDNFFQGSSWISGSSCLVVNGFIAWLSITFYWFKGPPNHQSNPTYDWRFEWEFIKRRISWFIWIWTSQQVMSHSVQYVFFSNQWYHVGVHLLHITPPWKKASLNGSRSRCGIVLAARFFYRRTSKLTVHVFLVFCYWWFWCTPWKFKHLSPWKMTILK